MKPNDALALLQQQVLDRIDIRAAYVSWGVDVIGTATSDKGWVACRSHGKADKSPSAAINVSGEHPSKGQYKEHNGEGRCLTFWDAAVEFGPFASWQESRDHFAQQVGLELPEKRSEQFSWVEWAEDLAVQWGKDKGNIDGTLLAKSGAKQARYPKKIEKYRVFTLPILRSDGVPQGYYFFSVLAGEQIELFQGKGNAPVKRKSLVSKGSSPGWVGTHWRQRIESAETIWWVEGPPDMLALETAIEEACLSGSHLAISSSHGALKVPDCLAALKGKRAVLIGDADADGQKGVERRIKAISPIASSIAIITPEQLGQVVVPSHGPDVRDWLVEGHRFADLLNVLKSCPWQATSGTEPTAIDKCLEMCRDAGIVVIGEDEELGIHLWSLEYHKWITVRNIGKWSYPEMLQCAGDTARRKVVAGNVDAPGMIRFGDLKSAIAVAAGFRRITKDNLSGPGCWRGKTESGQDTNEVICVGNSQAFVFNGHLDSIREPIHGGRILQIGSEEWYDSDLLEAALKSAEDQTWCQETVDRIHSVVSRWSWEHPIHPRVMTGLVLATMVQTIWPWRPQVMIGGRTKAGKTILIDFLGRLFGRMAIRFAPTSTPTGIRQDIGCSGKVAILDEWDRNPYRQSVLDMLRVSGRANFRRVTGTAGQKAQKTSLSHIFWIAGQFSALVDESDRNRFIVLRLHRPNSRWPIPALSECEELSYRLLGVAIRHGMAAISIWHQLMAGIDRYADKDTRLVECYATPAAMISSIYGIPPETVLDSFLTSVGNEVATDEEIISEAILGASVDCGKALGRRTIGELLETGQYDAEFEEAQSALARWGIAVRDGQLVVAYRQASKVLAGSRYADLPVDEFLMRFESAKRARRRMSFGTVNCIVLDMEEFSRSLGQDDAGPAPDEFSPF